MHLLKKGGTQLPSLWGKSGSNLGGFCPTKYVIDGKNITFREID